MAMAAASSASRRWSGSTAASVLNRLSGKGSAPNCGSSDDLSLWRSFQQALKQQHKIILPTKRNLVLLGKPGCGKGTMGSRMASLLSLPHISTGDLIRQELSKSTALSSRISDAVSKGRLVPDEAVFELLCKELEHAHHAGDGFILDGFPRSLQQAKALEQVTDVDMAIKLNLGDEAVLKRCLGRRVCSHCGKTYNLLPEVATPAVLPPKACTDKLLIRKDDVEDSIKRRLKVYQEETKPVEEHYRRQGKLVDFDAAGGVEDNWSRLIQALDLDHKLQQQQQEQRWQ